MSDISMTKHRDRIVFTAHTPKGEMWMERNVVKDQRKPCFSVNEEHQQSYLDMFKEEGLDVEGS